MTGFLARMRAVTTLARWLGPWSSPMRRPEPPIREETVDGTRVRLYDPAHGGDATFVIAPGYSEPGPDDPRMDRFCRVLAAAGHRVVSPFVRDYQDMVSTRRAVDAFGRVVTWAAATSARGRVRVFSVSTGSVLALHAAAAHAEEVERLVVFGGYAELRPVLHYCLTGHAGASPARRVPVDPSNHAMVALNVLDDIEPPVAIAPLARALRSYVAQTCPPTGHVSPARFAQIAAELRETVPDPVDFDDAIGVRDGSTARIAAAISRMAARGTELDIAPILPRVRCRVDIIHGVADLVVPYEQAQVLGERLVGADARVHVISGYEHTGFSTRDLLTLARDARALVAVLGALS